MKEISLFCWFFSSSRIRSSLIMQHYPNYFKPLSLDAGSHTMIFIESLKHTRNANGQQWSIIQRI